jgi:hypothetical protein
VGVDVIEVLGVELRVTQGHFHAGRGTATLGMDVGDPIRVGTRAIADDFAVDLRAAGLGSLELFEDEHSGPFAQDEAVAIFVERARGVTRIGVSRGKGREQVEARDAERVNHAVSAAGKHHLGIAAADDFGRFADRLAGSGTSGEAVQVRALGVEQAGEVASRHVRFLFEFDLRVEPFEPALGELFEIEFAVLPGLGDHVHEDGEVLLAFTGAQIHAEQSRIKRRIEHTRVSDGLHGGAHSELHVAAGQVEALGSFVIVSQVVILHFRRELGGEVFGVKVSDGADAPGARFQRVPHRFDIVADGGDAANTRNDYAASHSDLPFAGELRRLRRSRRLPEIYRWRPLRMHIPKTEVC